MNSSNSSAHQSTNDGIEGWAELIREGEKALTGSEPTSSTSEDEEQLDLFGC